MWPNSPNSFWLFCSWLAGTSLATGIARAWQWLNPPCCGQMSAPHWRRSPKSKRGSNWPIVTAQPLAPPCGQSWRQHRLFAIALCLLMLPGCSLINWRKPEPAPQPTLELSRVDCAPATLTACEVVEAMAINNAADTVTLASDALSALDACADKHAELVVCVLDFNARGRK